MGLSLAVHVEAFAALGVRNGLPYDSARMLETLLHERRLDAIVIDLPSRGRAVSDLVRFATSNTLSLPVIGVLKPHAAAYDEVGRLLESGIDVRPVLDCSTLERDVVDALDQKVYAATAALLRELGYLIPSSLGPILFPAIILGRSHTLATTLSGWVPLTPGNASRILRLRGVPSAQRVLGLATGFHVAFDAQVQSLSLSEIARRRGFGTEDTLRQFLKRRTLTTPRGWKELGVAGAIRRIRQEVHL